MRVVRHWNKLSREVGAHTLGGSSVQGQVGWGFEQPGLVECVSAHGRGLGTSWFYGPFQLKPFCDSMIRHEVSDSLTSELPKEEWQSWPMQLTHRGTRLLLQSRDTGHLGGPVVSCIFPSCCARSCRSYLILASLGRMPLVSQEIELDGYFKLSNLFP